MKKPRKLNREELATILAALRTYQRRGPAPGTMDIATDGGTLTPLDDNEIDELCEALNFGDIAIKAARKQPEPIPAFHAPIVGMRKF